MQILKFPYHGLQSACQPNVNRHRRQAGRNGGIDVFLLCHFPPPLSRESVDVDADETINGTTEMGDKGDDVTWTDTDSGTDSVQSRFVATYETNRPSKTRLVTSTFYVRKRALVVTGDKAWRVHVFRVPKIPCASPDGSLDSNQYL